MKLKTLFLLAAAALIGTTQAQITEVQDDRILSFEQSTAPLTAAKGSTLKLSTEHYKHGQNSVRWDWKRDGAQALINAPVDYIAKNPNPKETSVSTFVFWVYAPKSINGSLRVEFRKQGRLCSWFDYTLGFTGWRGAWIAFDRDMQGKPEEGMDQVVVTVNGAKQGTLFFDHWILSSFQDIRQHTADFQAPYINPNTNSHWLILLKSWNTPMQMEVEKSITPAQQAGMETIKERLTQMLLKNARPMSLNHVKKQFDTYGITENPDGTIKGKPIHFIRYAETYLNLGHNNISKIYQANNQTLRGYNDFMYRIAVSYNCSQNAAEREELARIYLLMMRHLLDQGFAAGSAQGTLHHLGYSMRNFYTGPVLMHDVLRRAELDQPIQQAMEWFSGAGEVKLAPTFPGIDIDAFNTSLIGRIASILMMRDTPEKVAYLRAFSRWADNGFKFAPGSAPCFKSDGTVFHHRHHYPAYATGGFDGGVNSIWLLNNTVFAISRESHENQKNALLAMRFYCNQQSFPLALSGRHPDGKGALIPRQYALLAQAGSPDGSQPIDRDLAAAYMRFSSPKDADYKLFAAQGITPEQSPEGCRVFGYNASLSHRRADWLLTIAGHSRYIWSGELYVNQNHYGRYLSHGSMQLLGDGTPVNSFGSGFRQEGWDWCRIPGTTAAVRPMPEMKADIRNVDTCSGYEEMLLSDETFAGGVSHKGRNGAFGMKLHENDKYNGSLRARKSWFLFDNRVVALGSDIENALQGAPANTTLFQNCLVKTADPIHVNGAQVTTFPYEQSFAAGATLVDNLGTAYFIPRGEVHVTRMHQHSLHEESDAPTEGDFAKAWINHGDLVKDGSYEYLMVVKPTGEQMTAFGAQLPYRVLERSRRAHIVRDEQSATTGYVLFEAGAVKDELLTDASMPSLVMISGTDTQKTVSLCDPDLHFYEGPADDLFGPDGKSIERSIYSRKWINDPSKPSEVRITLRGEWQLASPTADCRAEIQQGNTILIFTCREASTREITINKL